jgi:hypothetical protein
MTIHRKHTRVIVTVFAVLGLVLASASSGEAKSRIPAPKPGSVRLVQTNSGWCGSDTFAVIVDGRRAALLC